MQKLSQVESKSRCRVWRETEAELITQLYFLPDKVPLFLCVLIFFHSSCGFFLKDKKLDKNGSFRSLLSSFSSEIMFKKVICLYVKYAEYVKTAKRMYSKCCHTSLQ